MTRSHDQDERDERRALTLHEERLVASERTEAREIGQVRLRKRIVVEEMTVTVPVRREVVDVVRVEVDGTETVVDAAPTAHELRVEDRTGYVGYGQVAEQEQETGEAGRRAGQPDDGSGVVCYEERPVITTEVFAVERVRLELARHETTVPETYEVRREEAEIVQEPHQI